MDLIAQPQTAWDKVSLFEKHLHAKQKLTVQRPSEFLLEGPGCCTVAIHTSRASKIRVAKNPTQLGKK